jgi:hypothetical protein
MGVITVFPMNLIQEMNDFWNTQMQLNTDIEVACVAEIPSPLGARKERLRP